MPRGERSSCGALVLAVSLTVLSSCDNIPSYVAIGKAPGGVRVAIAKCGASAGNNRSVRLSIVRDRHAAVHDAATIDYRDVSISSNGLDLVKVPDGSQTVAQWIAHGREHGGVTLVVEVSGLGGSLIRLTDLDRLGTKIAYHGKVEYLNVLRSRCSAG